MARFEHWRRDLSAPISMLQSELNKIFDEYWTPAAFGNLRSTPVDMERSRWSPAVNLLENPDAYVLTAEVPGVEPSSIDLSLTGNTLTLRGVKPPDDDLEPTGPVVERMFGPFHRQVTLPGEVDFEATQAEAKNGVLKIRLPKRETTRARTIPVQSI